MRTKVFFVGMLAAGLLILIPILGRADIHFFWFTEEGKPRNAMISALQYEFLKLRVSMMMDYPNEYPNLEFGYDESGVEGKVKPRIFEDIKELDTRGKIVVDVWDTRDHPSLASAKEEILGKFRKVVAFLTVYLITLTNDIDNDVVVYLWSRKRALKGGGIIGYFYKGEYVIGPFFVKDLPG